MVGPTTAVASMASAEIHARRKALAKFECEAFISFDTAHKFVALVLDSDPSGLTVTLCFTVSNCQPDPELFTS